MAKAAVKKSTAKVRQPKDRWAYMVADEEMCYDIFPSYEAAHKHAVKGLKEDSYYNESTKIKVQFYRLASESLFEFDVKETPVMKREVVFKGEVK